jgi:hypothetical protein
MITTDTLPNRPSTRLDLIAERAMKSRVRQRLFIAALAIIMLVIATTVAFAGAGAL